MSNSSIHYSSQTLPDAAEVLSLFKAAGILQPGWNVDRMQRALKQSSVVVTAWDGKKLVGIARSISDLAWYAYLSQLAVAPDYQRRGIGKSLLIKTKEVLGEEVALLTHSADAGKYYLKQGFVEYRDCYRLPRSK